MLIHHNFHHNRLAPQLPVTVTLENAVGRGKDVQDIDVRGEFEKPVGTLLVLSGFQISQVRQELVHTFVIQLCFPGLRDGVIHKDASGGDFGYYSPPDYTYAKEAS